MRLDEDDAVAFDEALLVLRRSATGRRPSFPFLMHHGATGRRLRRAGMPTPPEGVADLTLRWAKAMGDVRLAVYRAAVVTLGDDLPADLTWMRTRVDEVECLLSWARRTREEALGPTA